METKTILDPNERGQGENRAADSSLESEKTKDEVYFALSNYRRRFVLDHLAEHERPCQLRELVEALAAWENSIDPVMTSSVQRKRAYVSLRQTHLPKLDELDLVDFDAGRGTVAIGERFDLTVPHLNGRTAKPSMDWRVIAGLSALVIAAVSIALVGLFVV